MIVSSVGVVGRYPSDEEIAEFDVEKDAPVWLPTDVSTTQFTGDIRGAISYLREANIFIL